jgi:hypothetical protein
LAAGFAAGGRGGKRQTYQTRISGQSNARTKTLNANEI